MIMRSNFFFLYVLGVVAAADIIQVEAADAASPAAADFGAPEIGQEPRPRPGPLQVLPSPPPGADTDPGTQLTAWSSHG